MRYGRQSKPFPRVEMPNMRKHGFIVKGAMFKGNVQGKSVTSKILGA